MLSLYNFVLAVEHNVGVPMMSTRRGVAFPGGDAGCILSPRDAAGLGVKMVEYVLGGSPTGEFLSGFLYTRFT